MKVETTNTAQSRRWAVISKEQRRLLLKVAGLMTVLATARLTATAERILG